MQATLSKATIYTKQPTREWLNPYLTWGCANVLLRLYESERGSERSNAMLLNMYIKNNESCMRFCESCWERLCDMRVAEELLREVLWYESCVRCVMQSKYSLNTSESCVRCESFFWLVKIFSEYRPRPDKTWTWSSDNRHDQG